MPRRWMNNELLYMLITAKRRNQRYVACEPAHARAPVLPRARRKEMARRLIFVGRKCRCLLFIYTNASPAGAANAVVFARRHIRRARARAPSHAAAFIHKRERQNTPHERDTERGREEKPVGDSTELIAEESACHASETSAAMSVVVREQNALPLSEAGNVKYIMPVAGAPRARA